MDQFKSIVKRILTPAISAVSAVFGFGLLFPSERPAWVGLFIILGLGGVVAAGLFVRRLMTHGVGVRLRSVMPARILAEIQRRNSGVKQLQAQWDRAITFLKESPLKKLGDPMYLLPWYLMLGEDGSGKTSALRGAELASFNKDFPGDQTGPCCWNFFEPAVVIDTPGRYVTSANPEDIKEWERLLELLLKHRRREPLNGLVLTLSAERLLTQSPDVLQAAGQGMRKRVDDLMRALGTQFPVYLLVTQCDRVPGMISAFSQLSTEGTRQAMGGVNQNPSADASAFVSTTFFELGRQLKALRLIAAYAGPVQQLDQELLTFPNAFQRLETRVGAFVRGAFGENPYQETPLLRGLYFSATPQGHGLFLTELFAKILPGDRALVAPTQHIQEWWKKTMTMGVIVGLVFLTALAGLMTYSFVANLNLLRAADRQFSHLPAPEGDLLADIVTMDRMNQAILSLNDDAVGRWLPSFGLHESARVKRALQQKLSGWFWNVLLTPFDQQNGRAIARLTRSSSDALFCSYVEHLVTRLQLIDARQAGENVEDQNRTPPVIPSLNVAGREANDDLKRKFAGLYTSSVFWLEDSNELRREAASLRLQLKRLIAVKQDMPQWVIVWAMRQNSRQSTTLADFWGNNGGSYNASVPAIFSRKNKALVDAFFADIGAAMEDPEAFTHLKSRYDAWYRTAAFDAWHRFLSDFPRGRSRIWGAQAWRTMAPAVIKDDGPYFSVLNTVARELEPLSTTQPPAWLQDVYRFQELKGSQKRASLARKSLSKIGVEGEKSFTVAAALADYRQALKKILDTIQDRSAVGPAVGQALENGDVPGSSVFADGFAALDRLKVAMGVNAHDDPAVWRIIAGPMDYVWEYARRETAEQMQSLWEKKVLTQAAGIPSSEVAGTLLGADGAAIKFAQELAAPYVQWKPGRGYVPRESLGGRIPFNGSFFSFINSSPKHMKTSHVTDAQVTVRATGAESNPGAQRVPSSTRLTLRCGKKTQTVSNRREHLIAKTFNVATETLAWTTACGDTTLEIGLAGMTLTRVYPGPRGFLDFARDFQSGSHAFASTEFPAQAGTLAAMGVQTITAHYQLTGAPQGIPDYSAQAPVRIVEGWSP